MCPELQVSATLAEEQVFASKGHATQTLLTKEYPA